MIRLPASERYDDAGNLTPQGKASFKRNNLKQIVALFNVGDVVFDEGKPDVLGIVKEADDCGLDVVWEHGGTSCGPGLAPVTWHREPRVNVPVTPGMLGNRGWNREQAVKAALRKSGLRGDDSRAKTASRA